MAELHNVTLLQPADNSITPPLQKYRLPTQEEGGRAEDGSASWDALEATSEDRSVPAPVVFGWETTPSATTRLRYELQLSEEPSLRDPLTSSGLSEPQAQMLHLHLATRYFWKVKVSDNGAALAESPIWSFTTHQETPRWIRVPGITNVRDLGGWPLPGGKRVRQGLVYRSSEMNRHVEIADEGVRVLLDDLGICTDLDLRGVGGEALPALDPARVQWVNVPIRPYESIAGDDDKRAYREVFRVFADPANYPILFHCWGGADRAGTVALLLNALLGVSREDLIRDFELTSLSIWGPRSRSSDMFIALLDALRSFSPGGDINAQAENYLLSIGITAEEIAAIRAQMIEDAKG